MADLPLSWAAVLAGRLHRQSLVHRRPASEFLAVAAELCGVHAQVMSSAELTLQARVDGLEPSAVARALWEERSLVKTWAVRGTLHLLPADDLPTWIAALSTYRHFEKPSWQKAFLPLEDLRALIAAVGEELADQLLTREQLADAVATRTAAPALADAVRSSWGALLKPAAFQGQLCFGPGEGQLVRFTRPDTWLAERFPTWPEIDPEEALRGIVRAYLRTQGPASREDLTRWSALPPARAGGLLRSLGDEVVTVDVEGTCGVALADLAAEDAEREPLAPGLVRLLPAFDQYVVAGSRTADAVLEPEFRPRVFRPQGWLSPVVLVDGRVEGVWRSERRGRRLVVTIEPFRPQRPVFRSAVEGEAIRIARYYDAELEVVHAEPVRSSG